MESRFIAALSLAALIATGQPAAAQESQQRGALLDEYIGLLSLPDVASGIPDMERNAALISTMMQRRALHPQLLRAPGTSSPPLIYGEWRVPGATKTYVLYAHYDGQPANPKEWTYSAPFVPVVRTGAAPTDTTVTGPFAGKSLNDEWRIFARSSSDDKLGVFAILTAADRLRKSGKRPAYNLKIVFDGEEEAGSPHLEAILKANAALLQSDGWIIFDGPEHASGAPQVVLGVRGVTSIDVTTFGAVRPLHSGHYGNWAPNPAQSLARLLASMKDADGHVLVKGFYADTQPVSEAERKAIAKLPDSDADLANELGILQPDNGGHALAELMLEPSLDILGIRSADVGEDARNVIPATAQATIGLRLAKGDDPDREVARVVDHIRSQGFFVTSTAPTMAERLAHRQIAMVHAGVGYPAERTPLDDPFARLVIRALIPSSAVTVPTIGGSLPLYVIHKTLSAPTVTVSDANHDNNQHAENENLRLGHLWRAIDIAEAVMEMR